MSEEALWASMQPPPYGLAILIGALVIVAVVLLARARRARSGDSRTVKLDL